MDLEGITRSETSQRENDKYYRTLLVFGIQKKKKKTRNEFKYREYTGGGRETGKWAKEGKGIMKLKRPVMQ